MQDIFQRGGLLLGEPRGEGLFGQGGDVGHLQPEHCRLDLFPLLDHRHGYFLNVSQNRVGPGEGKFYLGLS